LGLTTLSGEPVMCVVVVQGKTRNILVETGVNLDADAVGEKKSEEDYEFFYVILEKTNYIQVDLPVISKAQKYPAWLSSAKAGE
jgi:hypothetical protein